ncbi:MAG: hypothetical protein AAGA58_12125 [Verrucomicrobiota bacterium]
MPAPIRLPLFTLVAVTALCLSLGENFPFSNFPMYRSFSDYSYYVYFTDADGKPLPIKDLTGHRTSALKKIYNDEVKDTRKELEAAGAKIDGYQFMTPEQRKPAGEYTLEWLEENAKEGRDGWTSKVKAPVRIHHVDIKVTDGKTTKTDTVVAEK